MAFALIGGEHKDYRFIYIPPLCVCVCSCACAYISSFIHTLYANKLTSVTPPVADLGIDAARVEYWSRKWTQ